MAYFYAPTAHPSWNNDKIGRNTLRALSRLPDQFHVLVEFEVPRSPGSRTGGAQVDFLVFELDRPFKAIVIEEKHIPWPIFRAPINGPWTVLKGDQTEVSLGGENPCQQTMRIADTVRQWLRDYAIRLFGRPPLAETVDTMPVYRVLFLDAPDDSVPIEKPSFLRLHRTRERMVDDLRQLSPRGAVAPLTRESIRFVIEALSLSPKTDLCGVSRGTPADAWGAPAPSSEVEALRSRVEALEGRMADLGALVLRLIAREREAETGLPLDDARH